jgi:hypothetical protein
VPERAGRQSAWPERVADTGSINALPASPNS